ncbi:eukaryotic translation initiation factor 4E1 [Drosophila albomicans]|uniref:eIF-4F 25 kDa subunit n=1 Tax=Drosophila albomicans TaxID=7291 RepID=A0A6P8XYU5_DROAB|nr:eukaryotic translation initiation factor 4E1 [Drosophila albomicans]
MSNFYKMKNFANPKTMFKSCSNNDDFSTAPVQSCTASAPTSVSVSVTASVSVTPTEKSNESGHSGSSVICKSILNASACCSDESSPCSPSDSVMVEPLASDLSADEQEDKSNEDSDGNVQSVSKEPHHPLHSEWTLWYLEPDRSKSWEEMLHEVASFKTVENFWSLINHIKTPSEIKMGSDYCLFKKGIRPMWEDEANVKGGRWVITLNKTNKNDLDNFWLDTMLVLIGESCDYSAELCGAVVNIRKKNNKISIWTANGNNEEAALEIGGKLRDGLRMESAYVLQYQLHEDTMSQQGSLIKTIYTR